MSNPIIKSDNPILSAMNEIVSGISALNMPPEPIENNNCENLGRSLFLSESDNMVKHAIEHFRAAIALLNEAYKQKEKDQFTIFQLKIEKK